MPTLIIYDSLYGNTEKIAQAIGQALGAHVLKTSTDELNDLNILNNSNLLIIGTPTHGGRPSQLMKHFLTKVSVSVFDGKRVAVFDTSIPPEGQNWFIRLVVKFFGYASKKLAAKLKAKGANVIAAETFFVLGREGPLKEGELERAKSWANKLFPLNKKLYDFANDN